MVTLSERIESREWVTGPRPSVTMHYVLDGTTSDLTAKSLLLSSTAQVYDGLLREECTLEPVFVDTQSGRGTWACTVKYVSPEFALPPGDEPSLAFDTGGGTQHVTQSISTANRYPVNAPDFKGAIGVTHESVEGVDIAVPVYNFSETHYFASISSAYRSTLFHLTGKVNNGAFKGMAAGECLFLGAAGSKRGTEKWEITFRFAGSPNRTGLQIGSITGIAKKGWEYLWVRYADEADNTTHTLVKKPVGVYIERVYEEGNFSSLGIGS